VSSHDPSAGTVTRALSATIATALPRAAPVFAERGLDGTRMEDIVRVTGIPRPTLYYHFSSKEEILAWLLDRMLIDLSVDVGEVLDRDEPAADRLDAVIGTYLALFAEHRHLCTVLLSELGRITRIPELAETIRAAFHEPVRKLLDAGSADGSLRKVDDELAASAIFGAVTMVGLHKIVADQPVDVHRTVSDLRQVMRRGIAPIDPGPGRKEPR
jgi:AcrR family transcriptional regulator